MERKVFSFELTNVDYEGRTFEGYAAAFGNVDHTDDVIHPGAFAKTIAERGPKIKLLWQHATDEPIGRPLELREDERGLFIRALVSDTRRGRDALALLKDQAIFEMSIGYEVPKGGSDYGKGADGKPVRNLRQIKLWEVSLVTFPANEDAVVTGVKEDEKAAAKEMTPEGPMRRLGDVLLGSLRLTANGMLDSWQVQGRLSEAERATLAELCGAHLTQLGTEMPQELALQELGVYRDLFWDYWAARGPEATKAGRPMAQAKLDQFHSAIDGLIAVHGTVCDMGETCPMASASGDSDGSKSSHGSEGSPRKGHRPAQAGPDDAPPTPSTDGAGPDDAPPTPSTDGAGPDDAPPTSMEIDVAEIEIALGELALLEV